MRWTVFALGGAMLLAIPARAQGPAVAAALEGDPELVATVGSDLARRGVATAAPDDAEAIRVTLAREPEGIHLALRDGQGRAAEREVATAETAAALIESWARPDLAGPLLERQAPVVVTPPPAATVTVTPVEPPAPAPAPAPLPTWNPALRLDGETGTGDGNPWLAASAAACRRVGPVCLGGEARLAHQLHRERDFVEPWQPPPETDLRAMFVAELPLSLGKPTLVLGLAAGLGLRWAGDQGRLGVRQEARATVVLPLWSRLAAEAGATAGIGPRGHDPEWPEARWVPGAELRLGLGLRWGLP